LKPNDITNQNEKGRRRLRKCLKKYSGETRVEKKIRKRKIYKRKKKKAYLQTMCKISKKTIEG
jgi:hypothetical protein